MVRDLLPLAFATIFATALTAHSTLAMADDCQTVFDAFVALSKVPAYRQTTVVDGMPLPEMVTVGDMGYYKQDDNVWVGMDFGPGGRAAIQNKYMPDAASLKDCANAGPDTVDGKDAVMYDYTTPLMPGPDASGPMRLWISTADGLPLRTFMNQSKTDTKLYFENVTAPASFKKMPTPPIFKKLTAPAP